MGLAPQRIYMVVRAEGAVDEFFNRVEEGCGGRHRTGDLPFGLCTDFQSISFVCATRNSQMGDDPCSGRTQPV